MEHFYYLAGLASNWHMLSFMNILIKTLLIFLYLLALLGERLLLWYKRLSEDSPCYSAVFDFVQGMILAEGV